MWILLARKIIDGNAIATWSPDGRALVITVMIGSQRLLRTFEISTGKVSDLPSSLGKFGADWVNANTIVANDSEDRTFKTFDLATKQWTKLLAGDFINWYVSFDRKYLYFTQAGNELFIKRIKFSDHRVETIGSLKGLRQVVNPISSLTQIGVAPDGSPLFTRDLSSQEIYALNIKWH